MHIKPNKNLISDHRKEIGKNLDSYSSKYDNFIFPGDLDTKTTESAVRGFYQIYGYENLIKYNGFFKNPEKPSCIDLIITNRPKCFLVSVTLDTGLSDFHKMTLAVMKIFYKKQKSTIIAYCSHRHFSNEAFVAGVQFRVSQVNSENNNL